ncbi:hypothetical protein EDB85DRAFT_1932795 [Lactarius pseudohatsudake]|nr:hypothetical protein EDB85DRAFT_1932795 [Lactarius pseudohatsudake]
MAQRLLAWPKYASSESRNLVLGVLKSHNEPLSTRELFEKAVKVPHAPGANGEPLTPSAQTLRNAIPAPPHPDHPVRSLTFLKRTILEALVRTRDVKKVHIKRVLTPAEVEHRMSTMSKAQLKKTSAEALSQPVSTWMWQPVDKSATPVRVSKNKDEDAKVAFGVEVGVGEDWGHLNRRRRRVREEKVARDVKWMRKVQGAREVTKT